MRHLPKGRPCARVFIAAAVSWTCCCSAESKDRESPNSTDAHVDAPVGAPSSRSNRDENQIVLAGVVRAVFRLEDARLPDDWAPSSIGVHATELAASEKSRSIRIARDALAKYPASVIWEYL